MEGILQQVMDLSKGMWVYTKDSKGKIYSLHEPEVSCIAKGKQGKKYEFSSKVSIVSLPGSQIIVGIKSYQGNPHDSKTLIDSLEQVESLTGKRFERVITNFSSTISKRRHRKGYRTRYGKGYRESSPKLAFEASFGYQYCTASNRAYARSTSKNHKKLTTDAVQGTTY